MRFVSLLIIYLALPMVTLSQGRQQGSIRKLKGDTGENSLMGPTQGIKDGESHVAAVPGKQSVSQKLFRKTRATDCGSTQLPSHLSTIEAYDRLNFNPNGISETMLAIYNFWKVKKILEIAENSRGDAKARFERGELHNGPGDAFRHALAMYRVTKEYNAKTAKAFGDAHERSVVNPVKERLMDLFNNEVGRCLAEDPSNQDKRDVDVIMNALNAGKLQNSLTGIRMIEPYQEEPCKGKGGICVHTSCCPNNNHVDRQCPTQSAGIKCCYSTPTCPYNESPCQVSGGVCENYTCCQNGKYSNYNSGDNECPTQDADIKCCYGNPDCGDSAAMCGDTVKNLACEILSRDTEDLRLLTYNPTKLDVNKHDGANSKQNIIDTCNGGKAKISNYCCKEGCAPGGNVCLKESVLRYILAVLNSDSANSSNKLQVNSIAGACHSNTSYHYQGKAVDFQVFKGVSDWEAWKKICKDHGARINLGPGDTGHSNHTHCDFN